MSAWYSISVMAVAGTETSLRSDTLRVAAGTLYQPGKTKYIFFFFFVG